MPIAVNETTQNTDHRRVEQVLVEKSVTGAMPAFFRVLGDPRLHPVLFYNHPHLSEIHFTDGSVSQVKATKQKEDYEKRVGPVPESQTDFVERAINGVDSRTTARELTDDEIADTIRAQMRASTDELDSTVTMTDTGSANVQQFMSPTEVPTLDPYGRDLRGNPYKGDSLKPAGGSNE